MEESAARFGTLHIVVNNRIVNVVSAVVFLGPPDLVAYTGLTRTATAARTTGAGGGFDRVRQLQVVPAREEPRDLLSTLLYVVDEGSGFLTGQTINVDGGSAKH